MNHLRTKHLADGEFTTDLRQTVSSRGRIVACLATANVWPSSCKEPLQPKLENRGFSDSTYAVLPNPVEYCRGNQTRYDNSSTDSRTSSLVCNGMVSLEAPITPGPVLDGDMGSLKFSLFVSCDAPPAC